MSERNGKSAPDRNARSVTADVVLKARLLGFTGEEVTARETTVIEKGTLIPCARDGYLYENVWVPINGRAYVQLFIAEKRNRVVFENSYNLPWRGFWHGLGGLYNGLQIALRHIPVVGRTVEQMAPDAQHAVSLRYLLAVSEDGILTWCIRVGHKDDLKKATALEQIIKAEAKARSGAATTEYQEKFEGKFLL